MNLEQWKQKRVKREEKEENDMKITILHTANNIWPNLAEVHLQIVTQVFVTKQGSNTELKLW